MNFSFGKNFVAQAGIGPESACVGDVICQQAYFKEPAITFYGIKKGIPEGFDRANSNISFPPGHMTKHVHDPGHVNLV
ncbi:MAG: hypothetical protein KKD53_07885, partial [Proteobacteria bacterium]|nr:hypothetical protein [Pseudomonadota bacterium]